MIVYPNAKINIGLNVIAARTDRYHDLSSIFYPVNDLCDILEVLPANNFSFTSSGIAIPGNSNICTKAFELLKDDFGIDNVNFHLHKKIPIGAGLGGGSSDGAFALKALNKIFNLKLSNIELEKYALQLGADCPFFIENNTKYITGIGEKMTNINLDLSTYKLEFFFPDLHISTSQAYNGIIPNMPEFHLLDLISEPIIKWKKAIKNDFEVSAFAKYPVLKKMKENIAFINRFRVSRY